MHALLQIRPHATASVRVLNSLLRVQALLEVLCLTSLSRMPGLHAAANVGKLMLAAPARLRKLRLLLQLLKPRLGRQMRTMLRRLPPHSHRYRAQTLLRVVLSCHHLQLYLLQCVHLDSMLHRQLQPLPRGKSRMYKPFENVMRNIPPGCTT